MAIHLHFELPVGTANHLDICLQLAPQPRRHTDGVKARHSIRAGVNANVRHMPSNRRTQRGSTIVDPPDFLLTPALLAAIGFVVAWRRVQ